MSDWQDIASAPRRVQLSRAKGWRMPANTVRVARPGKFGNPFTMADCRDAGYSGTDRQIAAQCVGAFEAWIGVHWRNNWDSEESERKRATVLASIGELRGKNLACWCKPGEPCHADVLLKLANAPLPAPPVT